MKNNNRKYLDVPTMKEIREQYDEIAKLSEKIVSFDDIQEFMEKHPGIPVEVNEDLPESFDRETDEIESIRFQCKNILFYKRKGQKNIITFYDDNEGQLPDCTIDELEDMIEHFGSKGYFKINPNYVSN